MKRIVAAALLTLALGLGVTAQSHGAGMLPPIVGANAAAAPPVTLPCDAVTCISAWGMRKLKTGATKSVLLHGNDGTTTDIGFVGNDFDKSTADTFCTAHGSPCVMLYYDQAGTSDTSQATVGSRANYDNSLTANGHSTANYNSGGTVLNATISALGEMTVISTFYSTASAGNFPSVWGTGPVNSGNSANGDQSGSSLFSCRRTDVGASHRDVNGAMTLSAWHINNFTSASALMHCAIDGTNLAADNTAGSGTATQTAFQIGNWGTNGSASQWLGNIADIILIASSTTNGNTIACLEGTYWGVTVAGC